METELKTKVETDKDCCDMKSVDGYCPKPLENFSSYLSKKWSISIIMTIGNFGRLRFNDLLKRLGKARAKILSNRLRELENVGVISRNVYNESQKRVEYELTEKGKLLLENLKPLIEWAENSS